MPLDCRDEICLVSACNDVQAVPWSRFGVNCARSVVAYNSRVHVLLPGHSVSITFAKQVGSHPKVRFAGILRVGFHNDVISLANLDSNGLGSVGYDGDKISADHSEKVVVDGEQKRRVIGCVNYSKQIPFAFLEIESKRLVKLSCNDAGLASRDIANATQQDSRMERATVERTTVIWLNFNQQTLQEVSPRTDNLPQSLIKRGSAGAS
jgi:hypothetical protein